jgi:hypothetical protein
MGTNGDDVDERIKARAYQLWEAEGRPDGRDREHWEQAAREIRGEGARERGAGDRDFGDSAGYGGGGSALDRHDVGDTDLEEDRRANPLDATTPESARRPA